MPDFEAVEVLTQAKDRILEHGWGKGTTCSREQGGDHESYCLEDGICRQRGLFVTEQLDPTIRRAASYVKAALSLAENHELYAWNDRQDSAGPVFDALDEALLLAKEAPTPDE